ncbi:MAG: hypothetical protein AAGE52_31575 [Myxococcota bacterium]
MWVGALVEHATFGTCEVLAVAGETLHLQTESGEEKRIRKRFVRLREGQTSPEEAAFEAWLRTLEQEDPDALDGVAYQREAFLHGRADRWERCIRHASPAVRCAAFRTWRAAPPALLRARAYSALDDDLPVARAAADALVRVSEEGSNSDARSLSGRGDSPLLGEKTDALRSYENRSPTDRSATLLLAALVRRAEDTFEDACAFPFFREGTPIPQVRTQPTPKGWVGAARVCDWFGIDLRELASAESKWECATQGFESLHPVSGLASWDAEGDPHIVFPGTALTAGAYGFPVDIVQGWSADPPVMAFCEDEDRLVGMGYPVSASAAAVRLGLEACRAATGSPNAEWIYGPDLPKTFAAWPEWTSLTEAIDGALGRKAARYIGTRAHLRLTGELRLLVLRKCWAVLFGEPDTLSALLSDRNVLHQVRPIDAAAFRWSR